MTPELSQLLADEFLGKLVEVMIPERDNYGKEIPGKYIPIRGICRFIGENKLLDIPLQITIDGTPCRLDHINHVKLVEKKPAIFNDKSKSKSESKTESPVTKK